MDNKWFLRRLRLPSRTRTLAGLLILVALWGYPSRADAGAPDWFRTAARSVLPTYPADTNAVILLDEQLTTVNDSGEIKTLYRRAIKILRPEGRPMGNVIVFFDGETRLTYLKAWSFSAQGNEYELKEKDAIETSNFSESLYSDTRHKFLHIPASDPGSVIGYEYEQRRRPSILQDAWWPQYAIPVRRARFELRLPAGWEFRTFWINHAPQNPQPGEKNQSVWELENIPAIEAEPSMPDWRSLAARMGVTYFARHADASSGSLASWNDVGAWYARLANGRSQVTPQMREKVKELTSGVTTTRDKIRALAAFVQRDVRYVAIEIGIGGYQPHSADEIFSNRYGDCKDKATLLSAMLNEIGIKSDYVLINATRGVVSPDFPTMLEFNHVILAIRIPATGFDTVFYAATNDAKLGGLLFFDPTDPFTSLGYLPQSLQANYGLLVEDEGGQLVKLPLIPPSLNRLLRSAKLILTPAGGIYGDVTEIRWGYPAEELRAKLLSAPEAERAKMIEVFLGNSMGGFALETSQVENLDKPDEPLIVHYRFEAADYGKVAGNLLLVRPRVMGSKSDDLLEVSQGAVAKQRKYPVEFPAATLQSDMFEITLPGGFTVDELPPPVAIDLGFASYKSKVEISGGNVLLYARLYQINDVFVPTEHLGDLKKFYRQIAADERNSAVLKQAVH